MIFNPIASGCSGEYVNATYKSGSYIFAFMSPDGISVIEKSGDTYQVLINSICTISAGAKTSGGIAAISNSPYGSFGYKVTGDFIIEFGEIS